MRIAPVQFRTLLEGAAELVPRGNLFWVRRLPVDTESLIVDDELLAVADMAAGVRFVFSTDAHAIRLVAYTSMPAEFTNPVAPFDVVVNGELFVRQTITGDGRLHVDGLGTGVKRVEIWLPHFGVAELGELTLLGATTVVPASPERPHWIAYGSSITQCKESDGPSEAWPSIVAAEYDWRLTNLGFGGQCHLDPVVARHVRDTRADLITLCLGINVWGRSSLPARTLAPAIVGFIETIRDGHPTTPIVVTTPIASPGREDKPNEDGLTLSEIRVIVHETVVRLQQRGDERLHLVNGLDVMGMAEAPLLEDGLHPGPEGYRYLARSMSAQLITL